ncbi:MAG: recombinase family protein [Patescibacteria group bacterium]
MTTQNIANMDNTVMYLCEWLCEYPNEDDFHPVELIDQMLECQKFCQDNGFEIKDENIYYDTASDFLSSNPDERPGLNSLFEAVIRNEKITNIIVYRIDRLTRSLNKFLRIVQELSNLGVTVYSVTEPFNTETFIDDFPNLEMLHIFARMERDSERDRWSSMMRLEKQKTEVA